MEYDLFMVRSATQAQRTARVLNSGGLRASVQRLPVELSRQGCAYAVRVSAADSEAALLRLRQAGLTPERVLRHDGSGYREVTL